MGLLKHPKNNRYHNKSLDHPAQINVEHKITPDNLNVNHSRKLNIKPVTTAVNIRVDNHIRNEIIALIQLGFAKNNKDLVSQLVQDKVSTLNHEQNQRFRALKNILERKDVLNYQIKHPK